MFGSYQDDSLEIISDLDMSDQANNGAETLNSCLVTVDQETVSCDEDSDGSDLNSGHPRLLLRSTKMTCLCVILRQSRLGCALGKDSSATKKTHSHIHLTQFHSMSAASGSNATPTYGLLLSARPPARSQTTKLCPTTVFV